MNTKKAGINNFLFRLHLNFKSMIYSAFRIREVEKGTIFIAGWYTAFFALAYDIRMIRIGKNFHFLFILVMTIGLVLMLVMWGLTHGDHKNNISVEKKNK